jgi:hypothetical protein
MERARRLDLRQDSGVLPPEVARTLARPYLRLRNKMNKAADRKRLRPSPAASEKFVNVDLFFYASQEKVMTTRRKSHLKIRRA